MDETWEVNFVQSVFMNVHLPLAWFKLYSTVCMKLYLYCNVISFCCCFTYLYPFVWCFDVLNRYNVVNNSWQYPCPLLFMIQTVIFKVALLTIPHHTYNTIQETQLWWHRPLSAASADRLLSQRVVLRRTAVIWIVLASNDMFANWTERNTKNFLWTTLIMLPFSCWFHVWNLVIKLELWSWLNNWNLVVCGKELK